MKQLPFTKEETETFRAKFFPECSEVLEVKISGDFIYAKIRKEYTYEVKISSYKAMLWLFINEKI